MHTCRNERGHCVLEYPGTSLAQSTCQVLMNFRGTLQAQRDTLKDQKLLQRAQDTGGADGVAAAMATLKGEPISPKEVFDLTQPGAEQPEMAADGWEWSLRTWPEDSDKSYELKTVDIANELLADDEAFYMNIVDADISPTRLSSTGSTLSREADALNRQDAVCPHITDWLTMGNRKGHWVCAQTLAPASTSTSAKEEGNVMRRSATFGTQQRSRDG